MDLTGAIGGVSLRTFAAHDGPAVAAIANSRSDAPVLTLDALLHWSERPGANRERDFVVASRTAGKVCGYARIYADPPFDEPIFMAGIAPGTDEPLAEILCSYAEERARDLSKAAPDGGRLLARMPVGCGIAAGLLQRRGYREERHLLLLEADAAAVRAQLRDPPEIAIVEGDEADLPRAYETLRASFADHWGTSWPSYACWRHDLTGVPLIARSGSEVMGVLIVAPSFVERGDAAQFVELGVVPERRRDGVARALLRQGADWTLRHGRARICLYMDGESTTGAKEIFGALGFASSPRFTYWSKPVRAPLAAAG